MDAMQQLNRMIEDRKREFLASADVINAAILAGKLEPDHIAIIRKMDTAWHKVDLRGSQTTPRAVKMNAWEKSGKARMYINSKILSKTPREGKLGYIDLVTGEINGDRKEIAEAVASIGLRRETQI